MKRQVIEIQEEKCIGCGLCATACMQGAIEIIDGKAKLVSDSYCDGLGMCLPECPVDAIHLVEKETQAFESSRKNIKAKSQNTGGGCAGSAMKTLQPSSKVSFGMTESTAPVQSGRPSRLGQWPVQLMLVNPAAPYFENAHLLIAADCTAYSHGNFHEDFVKGRVTLIGCPKLDDNGANEEKIRQILANNEIASITVVRMEVPCCGGILSAVKNAMLSSGTIVPYKEVTLGVDGSVR